VHLKIKTIILHKEIFFFKARKVNKAVF